MKQLVLASGVALSLCLWNHEAAAYCRATTCNPGDATQTCVVDQQTQCILSGKPLFWQNGCITVNIQADGAPSSRISPRAAAESVARALETWLNVDCNGERPSLDAVIGGPVTCNVAEFSTDHYNANVVMFREDTWPYTGGENALGVTWLNFNADTGEIWDADIELNAATEELSVGKPEGNQIDLDSLIMHEVGHLLGLGHSLVPGATMMAGYFPGSIELRSPEADDIKGICAIYPPGRSTTSSSCESSFGFSELCASEQPPFVPPPDSGGANDAPRTQEGCTLGPRSDASTHASLAPLLALGWLAWRRRR
jgi:Matrixin